MVLMENFVSYQIVVFTYRHSLTGELTLKDKRLSDFINERVESMLVMRNVSVARLEDPANILHVVPSAVIPKAGIVLVFEPPQKAIPPSKRFYGYVQKEKYDVFLVLDGMEVRGALHTTGTLDLRNILINSKDAFLPITEATVMMEANRKMVVRQDAILVNSQRIRFFGSMQTISPTQPRTLEPPKHT